MHTRDIDAYGGLVNAMPLYALVFMFFTLANVGLPGTSGFVGEFLTLLGVFRANSWVGVVATTGVILSAGYALWLYRRVVLGPLVKQALKGITDMTRREQMLFVPLIALTLLPALTVSPCPEQSADTGPVLSCSRPTPTSRAISPQSSRQSVVSSSMRAWRCNCSRPRRWTPRPFGPLARTRT